MNRRNFFKVVTGFVAGIFVSSTAKPKTICRLKSGPPGPTTSDIIYAKLWQCADYATMSAPFVQHKGVWFFADQNVIKYCPKNKLRWDNWKSIYIVDDCFDFWLLDEGKLYWVGEHEKWEILTNPDDNLVPVRIRLCGYWDGENWRVNEYET